jgi:hypothetical protein
MPNVLSVQSLNTESLTEDWNQTRPQIFSLLGSWAMDVSVVSPTKVSKAWELRLRHYGRVKLTRISTFLSFKSTSVIESLFDNDIFAVIFDLDLNAVL